MKKNLPKLGKVTITTEEVIVAPEKVEGSSCTTTGIQATGASKEAVNSHGWPLLEEPVNI